MMALSNVYFNVEMNFDEWFNFQTTIRGPIPY